VDVVAYPGSAPHSSILDNPKIHLHFIPSPPALLQSLPRILQLFFKIVFQSWQLWLALVWQLPRSDYMLLQNPPCLPTFTFCQLACALRGTRLVIDWHNFGFSLLALSLTRFLRPILIFATWYEKFFGRFAFAHMCVSNAMKEELVRWGLPRASIYVLHDCPAPFFARTGSYQAADLFLRLKPDLLTLTASGDNEAPAGQTLANENAKIDQSGAEARRVADWIDALVEEVGGGEARGAGRPAVIVSSTSWTPDEDFSLLLDAAVQYEQWVETILSSKGRSAAAPSPARLLIIVTGKGPLRSEYERKISQLKMRHVTVRTLWLSFQDYAGLLGSADLGVCLHTSSSGLDLPMKVVDMFGCELPVCAVKYSTIHELVTERENGLLFETSEELRDCFLELFHDFPRSNLLLSSLQEGARKASLRRWEASWKSRALPVFRPRLPTPAQPSLEAAVVLEQT